MLTTTSVSASQLYKFFKGLADWDIAGLRQKLRNIVKFAFFGSGQTRGLFRTCGKLSFGVRVTCSGTLVTFSIPDRPDWLISSLRHLEAQGTEPWYTLL